MISIDYLKENGNNESLIMSTDKMPSGPTIPKRVFALNLPNGGSSTRENTSTRNDIYPQDSNKKYFPKDIDLILENESHENYSTSRVSPSTIKGMETKNLGGETEHMKDEIIEGSQSSRLDNNFTDRIHQLSRLQHLQSIKSKDKSKLSKRSSLLSSGLINSSRCHSSMADSRKNKNNRKSQEHSMKENLKSEF